MSEAVEDLAIVGLDARGEGVAENAVVVPGALPGERVKVQTWEKRTELVEIMERSPERAAPFCPWFGTCGGCAAQHMSEALYRAWKRGLVVKALAQANINAEVGPLIDAHGVGRRRATFHARFPHGSPDEVGLMRARSHDIVAIDACPLFAPSMAGAVAAARTLAGDLRGLGKPLDIGVTATNDGLDVDLRGAGPLGLAETRKLARTAEALDLARVSNHGAVVVERRPPRVAFGDTLVTLPPGGFLQATEEGEARLAAFAEDALKGAKKVADLFCGAGAFALRLARTHDVSPPTRTPPRSARFSAAAGEAPGLRAVTAETRDLFRRPLSARELSAFRRRARSTRRAPGRRSAGARNCGEQPAACRRHLLQRRDLRPRRAHPDRRRVSPRDRSRR